MEQIETRRSAYISLTDNNKGRNLATTPFLLST